MPINWRLVGDDRYTCVPPTGYEIDPAVTRAIHEFDLGVIPFWRVQIWEADGRPRQVVHHGIARYYPWPRNLRRHIHFDMPAGAPGPVPNFLDAVLEDQTTLTYMQGGPGGYVPWDWALYAWCRAKYETLTVRVFMARHRRRLAREEAIRKAHEEEIEYRRKQLEPYLMRQFERLTPQDWAQLRERQHRLEVAKRLGRRPNVPLANPKPFVHIVRSPRTSDTTYGRVAPAQEMNRGTS